MWYYSGGLDTSTGISLQLSVQAFSCLVPCCIARGKSGSSVPGVGIFLSHLPVCLCL